MPPAPGDGPSAPAAPGRRAPSWRRRAPGLLLGAAALTVPAAWQAGVYAEAGWAAAALLVQGALLNVALFAAYLALRERWMRQEDEAARLQNELRYLRAWSGEEGRLRKAGLIRDLNALGAVPLHLEQTWLAGADLSGADLRGCALRESDLRGANLQGARLDGADLWGADLTGANLTLASLHRATLRGCALRDAQLPKANLESANLHRADLVNANLEGARLEGANLERARFAMGDADAGEFPEAIHPSVEDWIREKLDERGCYLGGEGGDTPAKPKSRRVRG
jgi:uncharacterized protein YjbI with pentapeptide repeats